MPSHFTSIRFRNYKAFKNFSVALTAFNILVGPNNAGKSTVIGSFRILAEGMRRAQSKNPEYVNSAAIRGYCYPVNLRDLPVSTENVFCDYDESDPAVIEFSLSNGNRLKLVFPEQDACFLVCETTTRPVRSTKDFKREFDTRISFVPVLGPVEHDEDLNERETARRALLTHRASRNFRNIWYHFPEGFEEFQGLVRESWPGMEIGRPELTIQGEKQRTLHMFCPEERIPRELYWAGFGFQVWCQMLTFIAKSTPDSLLIIDEPDIYLHSDLQRQLVGLLRARRGDVLIATHSTEILSEADLSEIVVLNKKWRAAKRVHKPAQLQSLFADLGSRLNPIITQLAKTRRAVFVEGGDFSVLAAFARKLGRADVANEGRFAVIPAKGFNPTRVKDYSEGMERTLGASFLRFVVFDRDYRSDKKVIEIRTALENQGGKAWIHHCKEIENFLLVPSAIERAVELKIRDRRLRGAVVSEEPLRIAEMLDRISNELRGDVFGQFNSERIAAERASSSGAHVATISSAVLAEFDSLWASAESRLRVVSGKEVLSRVNEVVQERYGVSVTSKAIIEAMKREEVPAEMVDLIQALSIFGTATVT